MNAQRRAQIEIRKMKLPIRYPREVKVRQEICEIMEELGLNQTEFAELMGVHTSTVSKWIVGGQSPIFNRGLLLSIWWRGPIKAALVANRIIQVAFSE